jgi:hypothetical protein
VGDVSRARPLPPARERAHELLRRAQSADDPTLSILAHHAMGETSLHTGELLLARKHQKLLLSLYIQERDGPLAFRIGADAKQGILSYAGWILWLLGYPDQALERVIVLLLTHSRNCAMIEAWKQSAPSISGFPMITLAKHT